MNDYILECFFTIVSMPELMYVFPGHLIKKEGRRVSQTHTSNS
jgi:hypothetical protein